MLFPPFEPDRDEPKRRRFRPIPVRTLVPNLITLLALCAGLTAVRLAIEGKLEFALAAIVLAAVLDGIDGRIARLRLARFNVATADPNRPAWGSNFSVGMPAPAGAITVLLPIYVNLLGGPEWAPITFLYTLLIAFLMVSRLPVFSGKRLGTRVPREMVLPVFVVVVLFVALLLSYPWIVLTLGTLVYLGCLPVGFWSYRRFERNAAQAANAANAANAAPGAEADAAAARAKSAGSDERPVRLN